MVCRILPEIAGWTRSAIVHSYAIFAIGRSGFSPALKAMIGGDRVVVAPGFLANPEVRQWLNGVEPAWTMLEVNSYNALRYEPSAGNQAIRLEPDLTPTDLSGSSVTRNALLVLRRATDTGGLKLTATGNLSRAVVAEMFEIMEWPGRDKSELSRFHKVINEPDFLPVHFVRVLLEGTKLLRKNRDKLVPTRLGKRMLAPDRHGALQALLFHIALWHLNLGYFDRNPVQSWPQNNVGVVLWSLSASANDWMHPDKLTRLCTVPVVGVEANWDLGSFAMESRILRPLTWFGLLEAGGSGRPGWVNRVCTGRPRCSTASSSSMSRWNRRRCGIKQRKRHRFSTLTVQASI
jgi:hypothetical protein